MTQILLTKQLVVNLGNDENGEPKTVTLPAGLQEVDAEIAGHWFVKAHAQEITPSIAVNQELQDNFDQLKADHEALQAQSNAATSKIAELEKETQTLKANLDISSTRGTEMAKKLLEAEERSNAQSNQIAESIKQAKADAKTIADLQKQIAESAKADEAVKPDPKAK